MKKGLMGLLSLALLVTLAGCGGGDTSGAPEGAESGMSEREAQDARDAARDEAMGAQPAEGSGAVEAPAEPAMEEAAAPVVEEAPAVEAPAAEAPAGGDGLTGTKWTHNGISMEFKEGNKVQLSGGPLATVAPDGHEANYTLADGALSVEVFGQVYNGTWDGTKLVVDGVEAVMAQ